MIKTNPSPWKELSLDELIRLAEMQKEVGASILDDTYLLKDYEGNMVAVGEWIVISQENIKEGTPITIISIDYPHYLIEIAPADIY